MRDYTPVPYLSPGGLASRNIAHIKNYHSLEDWHSKSNGEVVVVRMLSWAQLIRIRGSKRKIPQVTWNWG